MNMVDHIAHMIRTIGPSWVVQVDGAEAAEELAAPSARGQVVGPAVFARVAGDRVPRRCAPDTVKQFSQHTIVTTTNA